MFSPNFILSLALLASLMIDDTVGTFACECYGVRTELMLSPKMQSIGSKVTLLRMLELLEFVLNELIDGTLKSSLKIC
jgi:hypothetical protein